MRIKGFTIRTTGTKGKSGAKMYALFPGKVDAVEEIMAGKKPAFSIVASTFTTGVQDAYHHASVYVYRDGNHETPVFKRGTQGFGVRTLNDACKERTRFLKEAVAFIKNIKETK